MPVKLSGLSSNLDTESIIKSLVSAYSITKDNLVKAQTKLSWKQDSWKSMNTKIYTFYSKSLTNMRLSSSYNKKAASASDTSIAKVTASAGAVSGSQSLEVNKLASSGYLTGAAISTETTVDGVTKAGKVTADSKIGEIKGLASFAGGSFSVGVGEKSTIIDLTADTTVTGLVSKLKAAGVNASFDATNQRFFISAKSSGADSDFTMTASNAGGLSALQSMGLSSAGAVRTAGEDSQIILNGATFTSASNNFNINGLTIQALNKTVAGKPITVTSSTDVDGIYDMIKGFFTGYNELINGLDSAYNATSAKGYEPLTADEKTAMTDTEVEAWEKKIKDALLSKDSTVSGVSNSLKTDMLGSFTVDGVKTTLSSFGINTLSYFTSADNEKGAYHIDGDSKDSDTSGSADKLRAAIASDPEGVTSFFSQLSNSVYTDLTARMKSSTLRSAYTIYNDKQLSTEYSQYTTKITDWEGKISTMEAYYNKKFSAMETAISRLNSNSASLTSLLGS